MRVRVPLVASVLVLVSVLVGACSTTTNHCAACDGAPNGYELTFECKPSDYTPPSRPINMLFLSGGGAHGAYGAGVLAGWSDAAAPNQRPDYFDVVTGISTGALQATHAFLGKAEDLKLYDEYTQLTYPLMTVRSWWHWFVGSSITDTAGLKKIIKDKVAPKATIDEVATAQAGGRMLCVGTLNLETGRFVAWDLGKVAKAQNYELYRDIVLASASVPMFSPLVQIDQDRHGDGGVRNQVFGLEFVKRLIERRSTTQPLQPLPPPAPQRDRAFIVVNGQIPTKMECITNRVVPIAVRTIKLMMNEVLVSDLIEIKSKLTTDPAHSPEILQLWIAHDYVLNMTDADFVNDKMCRLFCRGREDGLKGNWTTADPVTTPRPCNEEPYPPNDDLDDSDCPELLTNVTCPPGY